jgi:hypothetical protein
MTFRILSSKLRGFAASGQARNSVLTQNRFRPGAQADFKVVLAEARCQAWPKGYCDARIGDTRERDPV